MRFALALLSLSAAFGQGNLVRPIVNLNQLNPGTGSVRASSCYHQHRRWTPIQTRYNKRLERYWRCWRRSVRTSIRLRSLRPLAA